MNPNGHTRPSFDRNDEDAITALSSNELHSGAPTPTRERSRSNADSARLSKPEQDNSARAGSAPVATKLDQNTTSIRPLRYRKRSLILLLCYLPFLIVPWVLTCIMAIRPPSLPSYYNQKGEYGANLYLVMLFWMGFIRVLNSIASLLTVPVVSALLAQGAVVFSQRRKVKQALNLRQTFTLADRGWNDIPTLWAARHSSTGMGSKYLWLAAALLLLSSIQVPVQQALVSTETITIMTCQDQPIWDFSPYCDPLRFPTILGYDPEPYDLARIPQNIVVRETANQLAMVNDMDVQLHLWHIPSGGTGDVDLDQKSSSNTFFWFYDPDKEAFNETYFVAAMPNDTETGILREHVIRLNSTAKCTPIAESAFPSSCSGPHPLETSFKSPNLTINICVPGDYTGLTQPAWNLTRNPQNLSEELYISAYVPYFQEYDTSWDFDQIATNFTVHCTANTTRGYFELGNILNNFTPSDLVQEWPDNTTMWNDFNDYLAAINGYVVPSEVNVYYGTPYDWTVGLDPFATWNSVTPGPLMTSALAMFGNESFFFVAANGSNSTSPYPMIPICQAANVPFSRLSYSLTPYFQSWQQFLGSCNDIDTLYFARTAAASGQLENMLYNWFTIFNSTDASSGNMAKEALEIAMFFANQAWLTNTAAQTLLANARPIYFSPGSPVFRPAKTVAGTVIISTLILLQIVGLSVLVWYIYTVPTWASALDSVTVVQLARDLGGEVELPPMGEVDDNALEKLKDVDGLVGIADGGEREIHDVESEGRGGEGTNDERVSESRDDEAAVGLTTATALGVGGAIVLARGGPGLITKAHAPPKKRTRWWSGRGSEKALPLGKDIDQHDT